MFWLRYKKQVNNGKYTITGKYSAENTCISSGISLRFGVAGKHCQETGQIDCFMAQPNGPIFKVAGTEGKVGGCFCRLPALNENTV